MPANEIAAENRSSTQRLPSDFSCTRRWSHDCPDGWGVADGLCVATASYRGGCATPQSFVNATAEAKADFATVCLAAWPCEDHCAGGHDYEACPLGWEAAAGGACRALGNVSCAGVLSFGEIPVAGKQDLAIACDVRWPCASPCERDFRRPCPMGWLLDGTLCSAPAKYPGPCDASLAWPAMTAAARRSMARKCMVIFPCSGAAEPLGASGSVQTQRGALTDGPLQRPRENRDDRRLLRWSRLLGLGAIRRRMEFPSGPVSL